MSYRRKFNGEPVSRLIVSVPIEVVDTIDELIKRGRNHQARANRSEFVRLAILEKLVRDTGH